MRLLDPDGKEFSITLGKYVNNNRKNASKLHLRALLLLQDYFPAATILQEVYIKKWNLYLDFFIPSYNLIVEVDGSQHEQDNRFFYRNKMEFYQAKARDRKKEEFCHINSINIIRFSEKEKEDQWIAKLTQV